MSPSDDGASEGVRRIHKVAFPRHLFSVRAIIYGARKIRLAREANTVFTLEMIPARYPGYGANTVINGD